ncbi:hypothetical protein Goarm_023173, partial [Gossypium armourianum]|nr:hypothetical protein [Gossypium armourianum]
MIRWKMLCKLKAMGGLGIRNVRLFNLALLGRQVWRLINNTDTLCFKVLSSKYFLDGNIFNAKKVDKASFTWTSIATVAEALKEGFGWQIGNGERINIWDYNWGMEGLNGDVTIRNTRKRDEKSVKNLWHVDQRVAHEILPTNSKIASIRQYFDKGCPQCGAETETVLHALKDCPTSRVVLSIGGWSRSFISKNYDHCIGWLEDLMRVLNKRAMADLMTTLWNCWNNRKNFILRGKEEEAKQIWERASNLTKEFRICNIMNEPLLSQN